MFSSRKELMLQLDDPLWQKLDDAHRDRNIPKLLSELANAWHDEKARSLFWDCLCHQRTCYGSTYAAVPHLLKIAESQANRHQRLEIALCLGFTAFCAFDHQFEPIGKCEEAPLRGLPDTLVGWDRKLDCYRSLVALDKNAGRSVSAHDKNVLLPRFKKILQIDPINESDLVKIRLIRLEFFSALQEIRALCEVALLENLQDKSAVQYLLCGVAAADGLHDLASVLQYGMDGQFRCPSCSCIYEYALFNGRVAIYVTERRIRKEDRTLNDFRAGAPSRADGFMVPIAADAKISDGRAAALLALANCAASQDPALLVLNFLGRFQCCKCGAEGRAMAV